MSTLSVGGEHQIELGVRRGFVVAALVAAAVNFGVVALTNAVPPGGGRLRLLHYVYDAGQHLAVALIAAGVDALLSRVGVRRARWFALTALLVLWASFAFALWGDLSLFVQRWAGAAFETTIKIFIAVVCSAVVVGLFRLIRRLEPRGLRAAAAALGLATLVVNHFVLLNDYPGVHLLLSFVGATVIASAASTVRLTGRSPARRASELTLGVLFAGLAVFATATRVPSGVLIEMLRTEGSSIAPFVARLYARISPAGTPMIADAQWFVDRSRAPAVPPSRDNALAEAPIVLLITIDALRADVMARPDSKRELPTLAKLEAESVTFTQARTPGAQTVYTLTTMFAGTYFSQQFWSVGAPDPSTRASDSLFPHADTTIRFPQLLQKARIPTLTSASSSWLVNSVGVLRGFDKEEFVVSAGERYTLAPDLTDHALRQLRAAGRGPLFFYMHYLDPHAPYTRGRRIRGGNFERYMEELRYVDQELGRFVRELQAMGLWGSTVLIVTADHGEAFGEHGSQHHATTLYEEQLHVPLLIRAPGVAARRVDEPVSLIDLGPTILDMFRQPTPGHFLGQSLLGFLRGESPKLTRPIVAEGRLKKAWLFRDGFKLIVDDHTNSVELYDLRRDPHELNNVFDHEHTARSRLATLRLFFEVHAIRRPGYVIPYRR